MVKGFKVENKVKKNKIGQFEMFIICSLLIY